MEQLVLELQPPEPPTFANFVVGPNAEAVAAVAAAAVDGGTDTGVVLWGAPGVGKTHLLRAAVAAALAAGRGALYVAEPGALVATVPDRIAMHGLVAVDALDGASAAAQERLFTLFNALRAQRGRLLVAAGRPPAALALRGDLGSRLSWGLVYEVLPLSDRDKPAALVAWARQRGFGLSEDVIGYLLAHGRRDMPSLLATLAALDRHSLAAKRPITVPLIRDWLQRDIGLAS